MMHQTDRDRLYRYLGFASSGTETTMTRSEARMFRPPHPERTARRPMPGGDVRFREFATREEMLRFVRAAERLFAPSAAPWRALESVR